MFIKFLTLLNFFWPKSTTKLSPWSCLIWEILVCMRLSSMISYILIIIIVFNNTFTWKRKCSCTVDILTSFYLWLETSCLLIILILNLSIFPINAPIITFYLSCLSTRSFTFDCYIFLWQCEYLQKKFSDTFSHMFTLDLMLLHLWFT